MKQRHSWCYNTITQIWPWRPRL